MLLACFNESITMSALFSSRYAMYGSMHSYVNSHTFNSK
jgi:hypothetical protein